MDGNADLDVGWIYGLLRFVSLAYYDTMSEMMDTGTQPWFCRRPPAVWDSH